MKKGVIALCELQVLTEDTANRAPSTYAALTESGEIKVK